MLKVAGDLRRPPAKFENPVEHVSQFFLFMLLVVLSHFNSLDSIINRSHVTRQLQLKIITLLRSNTKNFLQQVK